MFIGLLTSIVNVSTHTKYISLNNQKCVTQITLINLHPNKYSQGFHYYAFVVNLDRCIESCITFNDLSNRVYVPDKTEDLNLNVFNFNTGTNVSKILAEHIPCKCQCKFNGRKCNSNQKYNDKSRCECKNPKELHAFNLESCYI